MTNFSVNRCTRRPLRTVVAAWLLGCFALQVFPAKQAAAAEPHASAQELKALETANRAKEAYESKNFGEAGQLYLLAFDADPSRTDWQYSAARAFELAEMFNLAAEHYGAFLAAPGAHTDKIAKAKEHLADVNRERAISVRYEIDAVNGTVADGATGLTWERPSAVEGMQWSDAKTRCEKGFASEWRLPSREELRTLLEIAIRPGMNSRIFPNIARDWHWSSTHAAMAFAVNFATGEARQEKATASHHALCVRATAAMVVQTTPVRPAATSNVPPVASSNARNKDSTGSHRSPEIPDRKVEIPAEASSGATPHFIWGGVALGTGIVIELWALADLSALNAQTGAGARTPISSISFDQATAEAGSINGRQVVAGILGVAGGIGLIIGIVKAAHGSTTTADLSVFPTPGGGQATVSWRF